MTIFTWRNLTLLAAQHPQAMKQLVEWRDMVAAAAWANSQELKRTSKFHPSIISNTRVVFDIKGNDYRLVCDIRYADAATGTRGAVFVKFFGTHEEYDEIDPATVEEF